MALHSGVLPVVQGEVMNAKGFSLLEMSIVLLLVGLLLGGVLMPYASGIEYQRRKQTEQALHTVQQSLYGHAIVFGRLPCPDCRYADEDNCDATMVNDGIEDLYDERCASEVGNLPWASLGVDAKDAWGNPYTYRVSAVFARTAVACQARAHCTCNASGMAFTLCDQGQLSLGDGIDGVEDIGRDIPAVVVSHGANRLSAEQHDAERENYEGELRHPGNGRMLAADNGRAAFFVYQHQQRQETEIVYDDLLIWLSPYVLKNRLIQAGRLP